MSMRAALDAVTFENILQTLHITHEALSRSLRRPPRIAVAGLNPHAGESGHMGREEIDTIIPALEQLRANGFNVIGPLPGDTIFSPSNLKNADVILAMSHDQGLAPFKFATFGDGVNVTLGLPIIRTSVDHGTALSIAGKGLADSSSMIAALEFARNMARNKRGTSSS
jgi:4-hydroxythreonine-4-phosphate dehydrogenase